MKHKKFRKLRRSLENFMVPVYARTPLLICPKKTPKVPRVLILQSSLQLELENLKCKLWINLTNEEFYSEFPLKSCHFSLLKKSWKQITFGKEIEVWIGNCRKISYKPLRDFWKPYGWKCQLCYWYYPDLNSVFSNSHFPFLHSTPFCLVSPPGLQLVYNISLCLRYHDHKRRNTV